jgi:hypothetical protein
MILLVISDWSSVCGWNAELVQSLVPVSQNNSFHSVLVNTESQITDDGLWNTVELNDHVKESRGY